MGSSGDISPPNIQTSNELLPDNDLYAEMGDVVQIEYLGRTLPSLGTENLSEHPIVNYIHDHTNNKSMSNSQIFTKVQNCFVTLGDGDVIPALEMAIRFLPVNAYGIVRAHPKFAYGLTGYKCNYRDGNENQNYHDHPPNSAAEFHIIVKSCISSGSETFLKADFVVKRGNSKKIMGNDIFKYEQNYLRALKLYQSSAQLMVSFVQALRDEENTSLIFEDISMNKEQIEAEARGIIVDCLNNTSLVHYKNGDFGKSKEIAASVITDWDPNNAKALFRAAKAAMMDPNSTYDEAKAAIDVAMQIMGEDAKEIKRLMIEWKQKYREHRKKEKNMFSKMMGNSAKNKNSVEVNQPIHALTENNKISETQNEADTKTSSDTSKDELVSNETDSGYIHFLRSSVLVVMIVVMLFFVLPIRNSRDTEL